MRITGGFPWTIYTEKPGSQVPFAHNRILKVGVVIPLVFPNVPQSSLATLKVSPVTPLNTPPPQNPRKTPGIAK